MADDLILVGFILIFIQEILGAGKGDLVNILVHLFLCHSQSVILDPDRLFLGVYRNLNLVFRPLRLLILSHQGKLF